MKKVLAIMVLGLIWSGNVHAITNMKIECKVETNTMKPKEKYQRLFVIEDNRIKAFGSKLNGKPWLFLSDNPIRVEEIAQQFVLEGLTEKGTIEVFRIYLNKLNNQEGYFNAITYYGKYDYPFLGEGITTIDDWKKNNNFNLDYFYEWVDNYKLRKKNYLLSKEKKIFDLYSRSSPFENINYTEGKCEVVKEFSRSWF